MTLYYLLPLAVSVIIFLITIIEYSYSFVLFGKILGKYPIRKIKREENTHTSKLVIGMQIFFGIVLLVISIYLYYQ
jgi:hypothetical protein